MSESLSFSINFIHKTEATSKMLKQQQTNFVIMNYGTETIPVVLRVSRSLIKPFDGGFHLAQSV